MTVPKPSSIPLTPEENVLFDRIDFGLCGDYESRLLSLTAAADLAESLMARGAIPEVRLRYLTDPELNLGGSGKSARTGTGDERSSRTLTFSSTSGILYAAPICPK